MNLQFLRSLARFVRLQWLTETGIDDPQQEPEHLNIERSKHGHDPVY